MRRRSSLRIRGRGAGWTDVIDLIINHLCTRGGIGGGQGDVSAKPLVTIHLLG